MYYKKNDDFINYKWLFWLIVILSFIYDYLSKYS